MYRELPTGEVGDTSQMPEETKSQKATDKIEGRSKDVAYNEDGLRDVFEVTAYCELEEQHDEATLPGHHRLGFSQDLRNQSQLGRR